MHYTPGAALGYELLPLRGVPLATYDTPSFHLYDFFLLPYSFNMIKSRTIAHMKQNKISLSSKQYAVPFFIPLIGFAFVLAYAYKYVKRG